MWGLRRGRFLRGIGGGPAGGTGLGWWSGRGGGAYDAADCDDEAGHEDEADAGLAAPGDVEFEEVVEGEDEDEDVVGDVDGSEDVDLGGLLDAVTFVQAVPLSPSVADLRLRSVAMSAQRDTAVLTGLHCATKLNAKPSSVKRWITMKTQHVLRNHLDTASSVQIRR